MSNEYCYNNKKIEKEVKIKGKKREREKREKGKKERKPLNLKHLPKCLLFLLLANGQGRFVGKSHTFDYNNK